MSAMFKRWVERGGGLNTASRHGKPNCVCVFSRPDKQPQWHLTIPQAVTDVWSSLVLQATLLMPLSGPTSVCFGLSWLDRVGKKLSIKADLVIYCYIVTVSGQC